MVVARHQSVQRSILPERTSLARAAVPRPAWNDDQWPTPRHILRSELAVWPVRGREFCRGRSAESGLIFEAGRRLCASRSHEAGLAPGNERSGE